VCARREIKCYAVWGLLYEGDDRLDYVKYELAGQFGGEMRGLEHVPRGGTVMVLRGHRSILTGDMDILDESGGHFDESDGCLDEHIHRNDESHLLLQPNPILLT
jgi:hypothetical protein